VLNLKGSVELEEYSRLGGVITLSTIRRTKQGLAKGKVGLGKRARINPERNYWFSPQKGNESIKVQRREISTAGGFF